MIAAWLVTCSNYDDDSMIVYSVFRVTTGANKPPKVLKLDVFIFRL